MRLDRGAPAIQFTHRNSPGDRVYAYPTASNPFSDSLYLTVVPHRSGENPPGTVYVVGVPAQ